MEHQDDVLYYVATGFITLGLIAGAVLFNLLQVNIKILILVGSAFNVAGTLSAAKTDLFRNSTLLFYSLYGFGSGMNMILCL